MPAVLALPLTATPIVACSHILRVGPLSYLLAAAKSSDLGTQMAVGDEPGSVGHRHGDEPKTERALMTIEKARRDPEDAPATSQRGVYKR